jgi:hypothetical protein
MGISVQSRMVLPENIDFVGEIKIGRGLTQINTDNKPKHQCLSAFICVPKWFANNIKYTEQAQVNEQPEQWNDFPIKSRNLLAR